MSTVTDLESYQQFALQQQAQNNAWSAEQAAKQMDFQREMSNTAHQREVADLQAAGLNPVLSANSGASVPNGAAASPDNSAAANVGQILQQVLSAQSAREVAGMYNAATIAAAQIAAGASMYATDENNTTKREYPDSPAGVVNRIISALQHNENGLTSSAISGAKSIFARAQQAIATGKAMIKSQQPQYRDFYKWMSHHGGAPKQLGYGSQQWLYALRLYQQGKFTILQRFLDGFR